MVLLSLGWNYNNCNQYIHCYHNPTRDWNNLSNLSNLCNSLNKRGRQGNHVKTNDKEILIKYSCRPISCLHNSNFSCINWTMISCNTATSSTISTKTTTTTIISSQRDNFYKTKNKDNM